MNILFVYVFSHSLLWLIYSVSRSLNCNSTDFYEHLFLLMIYSLPWVFYDFTVYFIRAPPPAHLTVFYLSTFSLTDFHEYFAHTLFSQYFVLSCTLNILFYGIFYRILCLFLIYIFSRWLLWLFFFTLAHFPNHFATSLSLLRAFSLWTISITDFCDNFICWLFSPCTSVHRKSLYASNAPYAVQPVLPCDSLSLYEQSKTHTHANVPLCLYYRAHTTANPLLWIIYFSPSNFSLADFVDCLVSLSQSSLACLCFLTPPTDTICTLLQRI